MNLQEQLGLNSKELSQFSAICNDLLSHTFLLRMDYRGDKPKRNPDYSFVLSHFELMYQYLGLLDWELFLEDHNGYCYVLSKTGANRLHLSKEQTALFLCLRLLYDEKSQDLGLEHDVIISVQDLLDKLITDFQIYKSYNKTKIREELGVATQYRVIQKIKGALVSSEAQFAIMPSILTAVPSGRIHGLVQQWEKGAEDETPEQSATD